MTLYVFPTLDVGSINAPMRVGQILADIADKAVLTLNNGERRYLLSLSENASSTNYAIVSAAQVKTHGQSTQIDDSERSALEGDSASVQLCRQGGTIARAYILDGVGDRIALRLRPDQNEKSATHILDAVWPDLRNACLESGLRNTEKAERYDLESWGVLDQISIATMLLDQRCGLVCANLTGRSLLQSESLLKTSANIVCAGLSDECTAFRDAVAACAMAPDLVEKLICVTTQDQTRQVPVTLRPYFRNGSPSGLVLATLPMPPSREKVEKVARKLGLSGTEARVAALLQLGYSNREAAEISGLKPQTFNTYVKRVLGKLNVRGRAEAAQVLTWQAAGGGPK